MNWTGSEKLRRVVIGDSDSDNAFIDLCNRLRDGGFGF